MVDYSVIYKGSSEDKKTIYTEINSDISREVIMKVYNTYLNHPETTHLLTLEKGIKYWHYLVNNSVNRYIEFRDSQTYEIVGLFGLEGTLNLKDYDYDSYVYNLMRKLPSNGKHNVASVFNEIVCQNVYFNDFLDIDEGDVVFDIGFNYGLFSINALKKNPKKIVGFEPNPKLVKIFKDNVKDNRVEVKNCAVTNMNGKVTFYESISTEMSTIVTDFYGINPYQTIEVDGYSFMTLVEMYDMEKIDYLKVDCEGAEYMIFQSIPDYFLTDNIKKMAIEFHNKLEHDNVQNLIKRLQGLGFEIKTVIEEDAKLGFLYAKK